MEDEEDEGGDGDSGSEDEHSDEAEEDNEAGEDPMVEDTDASPSSTNKHAQAESTAAKDEVMTS